MELYLLRHAIAVDREDSRYPEDSLRPLTEEGRIKMQRNAQGMKALGLSFDLVLSSPYIRARQTAEIVQNIFKINKPILTKALIPEAKPQEIAVLINIKYYRPAKILLVGHEPHLSSLFSFLLVDKTVLDFEFKKGAMCHLLTTSPLK
jgi:phosphohistidine phosphatase